MKKIHAGLIALPMIVAMLLTACSTAGPQAGAAKPVSLLVFGSPDELAAYRTLVAAYKGGEVQLIEAGDRKDLVTRLSTSIAGGNPPDLFLMNYRFYGQFASKNAVEPVEERLAASKVLKASDFHPTAMGAFRWGGKQLCMPQNVSSLVVYYNRSLFQKYGIAEPKAGWVWNDMIDTAIRMTRDASGQVVRGTDNEGGASPVAVYGLGIEASIIRLAPFAWSNDGKIVDSDTAPTRLTLDDPPTFEALKNLVDLRQAYGVVPTDTEVEAEDDEARFSNGRLAMMLSSRRSTTSLRKVTGFEWDVAPLPIYKRQAGILHSDAYCITKGSKNKDAAWKFVEFAMGTEGQSILAATGRIVPSNIAVSNSPAFLDGKAPKNAQVFLDGIPSIRPLPTISTWPEIEDITSGLLENALYQGDRLDDVIAQIDKETKPVFARGKGP